MMRKFTRLNDKINKKGFNFDSKKGMFRPMDVKNKIKKSHHWLIFYRFEVLILILQNASMASFLYTLWTPIELG